MNKEYFSKEDNYCGFHREASQNLKLQDPAKSEVEPSHCHPMLPERSDL